MPWRAEQAASVNAGLLEMLGPTIAGLLASWRPPAFVMGFCAPILQDPKKYNRVRELLAANEEIKEAKKVRAVAYMSASGLIDILPCFAPVWGCRSPLRHLALLVVQAIETNEEAAVEEEDDA